MGQREVSGSSEIGARGREINRSEQRRRSQAFATPAPLGWRHDDDPALHGRRRRCEPGTLQIRRTTTFAAK
jgi:hypothetical protein